MALPSNDQYELYYDEMMEGPLECQFLRFRGAHYIEPRMGAHAEFLVTDSEHIQKYGRQPNESFTVTARFSPEARSW